MNTQTIIRGTGAIATFTSSICHAAGDAAAQAGAAYGGATLTAGEYLMSVPVYIWGPLLMLVFGCATWLLALVLIQPQESFPRSGVQAQRDRLAAGMPQLSLRR